MRAEALSLKMQNSDIVAFWADIRSLSPNSNIIPKRVDDAVGDKDIAELWRRKFHDTLNSLNDFDSKRMYLSKSSHASQGNYKRVTVAEIQSITKNLAKNKAVGMDGTPNEFYKFAPLQILIAISILFNAFLTHSFLPKILMNVLIVPLLKSN